MNINLEQILAWDLETIPKEGFNENHPLFDTWKNRNRKESLSTEDLIEKFNNEGGLYGEYLTIVCLSCAFIHEGEIRINSFTGDEKYIIDEFLKVAEFVENRAKSNRLSGLINLGHNIQNYDIPVSRKVYSRYYPMFTYPDYISDLNTKSAIPQAEKPWLLSERILDTLQLQKGGNYMFSSMAETAVNLGLASPKLDTDGSKVAKMFRDGEIAKIETYCEGDVLTSLKILFSWMGLEMLPIAKKQEKIEKIELPLLTKLYQTKSFSDDIKKEIESFKIESEEDKENLKKILLAHYQTKGDKVAIKKQKEEEVNEYINSLC